MNPKKLFHCWLQRLSSHPRSAIRRRRNRDHLFGIQTLEVRTLLSVSVLNNSGNGFSGLSFNQSGGYVPPDTNGAAGPSAYVETVNQSLALYTSKDTGSGAVTDSLSHFFGTTGHLTPADSGAGFSDPVIVYDEQIGRFIVGDQNVNFSTHVSSFDIAVSRSNNPATLSSSDWAFYKITTTESGFDADYPGNMGYNHDALVFTLNMFGVSSGGHTQVVSVNASDLMSAAATLRTVKNDLNDFSVRPTTMHDSVAGDPMWLVTEHGDGSTIDVIKMTGVLTTSASFAYTNLDVANYSGVVSPLDPNGTVITNNIDSRIMKAAEANNTIVATHAVSISSTQDVAQWYAIDVSSGTPKLAQQGRVSAGANTYISYPGIDINSSGQIGMSYMKSGTDTSSDFLSMWVTARTATDAVGTMETPVMVSSGRGLANYKDFTSGGRAGDLSGINVDPVNGTFWAANEFANTQSTADWGTAIANFSPGPPSSSGNSADMAVTVTGPGSITAGTQATYTITITNSGTSAAQGVVLSDTLPTGATLVSMTPTTGTDNFTFGQSGGNHHRNGDSRNRFGEFRYVHAGRCGAKQSGAWRELLRHRFGQQQYGRQQHRQQLGLGHRYDRRAARGPGRDQLGPLHRHRGGKHHLHHHCEEQRSQLCHQRRPVRHAGGEPQVRVGHHQPGHLQPGKRRGDLHHRRHQRRQHHYHYRHGPGARRGNADEFGIGDYHVDRSDSWQQWRHCQHLCVRTEYRRFRTHHDDLAEPE